MKVSFNELKSMSKGAARGSGLSWGQAEEVSFATVWLLKNGFDVSNDLISLLESDIIYPPDNIDEDIWQNKGGDLDPIKSGVALLDLDTNKTIVLRNVFLPHFLIPFVAQLSQSMLIEASNFSAVLIDGRVKTNIKDWPSRSEEVKLSATSDKIESKYSQVPKRCQVADQVWNRLEELTYLTYAPATEESRVLGAGAGLSDND
jgi:hypothetical protein